MQNSPRMQNSSLAKHMCRLPQQGVRSQGEFEYRTSWISTRVVRTSYQLELTIVVALCFYICTQFVILFSV